MKTRDTQRSKVYAAERDHSLISVIRIEDVKDIRRFVMSVMRRKEMKPWRHAFSGSKLRITDGRGRRKATAYGCFQTSYRITITLPRWARSMMVVLHELAHALTPGRYPTHGMEYCTNYLYLIKHVMGIEAYEEMIKCFTVHGVRYDFGTYED